MTDRESGLPRLDSLTIRLVTASDDAEFAATGLPGPSSRGAEEAGLATKTAAASAAMARSERMAPPGGRGLMLVRLGHEPGVGSRGRQGPTRRPNLVGPRRS